MEFSFKNLTIGKKIGLGFGVVLLLFLSSAKSTLGLKRSGRPNGELALKTVRFFKR